MKDNAKFPYPVEKAKCTLELIDSENGTFTYKIEVPDYVFEKPFIKENIGSLVLVAEVNCSSTMFRKCYSSENTKELIIEIPHDEVNIKYSIDCILISNTDKLQKKEITIQKGMPVAHLGTENFNNDSRTQGLIVFEPNNEKEVKYLFSDHTIRISLPNKQYEALLLVRESPIVKFALASNFAQIALLEACKSFTEPTKNNHLKWFQELSIQWNLLNNSNDSFPEPFEYLKLVTSVLENPSMKLIEALLENDKRNRDE